MTWNASEVEMAEWFDAPDAALGPFAHTAWIAARTSVLDALARGQSVALLGVSGVGKSLLLTELFRVLAATGRRVSLIRNAEMDGEANVDALLLDEADRLPPARLLELYRRPGRCVLAGLPALAEAAAELIPAPVTVTLEPLALDDVGGFVSAHLRRTEATQPGVAGPHSEIATSVFNPAAVAALAAESGRVPRSLQILAGLARFAAGLEGASVIAERHVHAAVKLRYGADWGLPDASSDTAKTIRRPAIERAFPSELAPMRPAGQLAIHPAARAIARPAPPWGPAARAVPRRRARTVRAALVTVGALAVASAVLWSGPLRTQLPARIASLIPTAAPQPFVAPPRGASVGSPPNGPIVAPTAETPNVTVGAALAIPAPPEQTVPTVFAPPPVSAGFASAPPPPDVTAAIAPPDVSVEPSANPEPGTGAKLNSVSALIDPLAAPPLATVAPSAVPPAIPPAAETADTEGDADAHPKRAALPDAATPKIVVSYTGKDAAAASAVATRLNAQGLHADPRARRGTEQGILFFFAEDAPAARRVAALLGGDPRPAQRVVRMGETPPGTIEVALPSPAPSTAPNAQPSGPQLSVAQPSYPQTATASHAQSPSTPHP